MDVLVPPKAHTIENLFSSSTSRLMVLEFALFMIMAVVLYNTCAFDHYANVQEMVALVTKNMNLPLEFAISSAISISYQASIIWKLELTGICAVEHSNWG